ADAATGERTRIRNDLHGTLGAALTEITLWQEVALAGAPGAGGSSEPLEKAQARTKAALAELRALVSGLGTERVSAAGLAEGIRRQTEGLCAAAGARLEFPDPDAAGSHDMASAYHAAKICVESITNAVRHGRAAT